MNMELGEPNKNGYKFNEVTSLTGVKSYVLRFWETEFEHINPAQNELGQKIYSPKDVDTIEKVKRLLFDDKLTIAQAKGYLDRGIIDFEDDEEEDQEFNFDSAPEVLIAPLPDEIQIIEVNDEEQMALKTIELKNALDAIIDKNSNTPKEELKIPQVPQEVITVKKKLVTQRLTDADTVSLVSAKKKLSVVLGKIDQIVLRNDW